jgi:hypothetical protein
MWLAVLLLILGVRTANLDSGNCYTWGLRDFPQSPIDGAIILKVTPTFHIFAHSSYVIVLLTPRNIVLLENLTGSQLAKKFSAFYGTRSFIIAFTISRHCVNVYWLIILCSYGTSQENSRTAERMGAQLFDMYRSRRNILGTVRMTWFKFHSEDPLILDATVQNLLAQVAWRPGFVKPWKDVYIKHTRMSRPALSQPSLL